MMSVIPTWKVTITFEDRVVCFGIVDNYLSNVMRKVADLDFGKRPMEQPSSIQIEMPK